MNKLVKTIIFFLLVIIISGSGLLIFRLLDNKPYTANEKEEIYQLMLSGNKTEYLKYINDGAKLSFTFKNGSTPLQLLVYSNDFENAKKLVENGFSLKLIQKNRIDILTDIMAYNEDFSNSTVDNISILLIKQIKDEIEVEDKSGYSLLINAIELENQKIVDEVLKHVQTVDKVYNNETALTYACLNGANLTTIKALVNKGADINAKGDDGNTCLMNVIALYQDDPSITQLGTLQYLVTLDGINLNAQNDFGQSALHVAVEYTNSTAIDYLLQNTTIDKTITDNDGYTPKSYAEYLNFPDIASKF